MLIRSVLFNFQGAFLNSVALISQATLLLYHIFSSLSRGFLNFFQSFFKPSWFLSRSDFLFESLYIISHSLLFVKRFLKLFSKFFVTFSLSFASSLSACILYHHFSRKSTLFCEFFRFCYNCTVLSPNVKEQTAQCTYNWPILYKSTPFISVFFTNPRFFFIYYDTFLSKPMEFFEDLWYSISVFFYI